MLDLTDAIKAEVDAELERHRAEINGDAGLISIALIIKLDLKSKPRRPGAVMWQPQSQRWVAPKARRET